MHVLKKILTALPLCSASTLQEIVLRQTNLILLVYITWHYLHCTYVGFRLDLKARRFAAEVKQSVISYPVIHVTTCIIDLLTSSLIG